MMGLASPSTETSTTVCEPSARPRLRSWALVLSVAALSCSPCHTRDPERQNRSDERGEAEQSLTRREASLADVAGDADGQSCRLRVAFIGDAGVEDEAVAVLRLIADEKADMVLHQGDLGYRDPERWVAMVHNVLGTDFPYFFSIGNHDGGGGDTPADASDPWTRVYGPLLRRTIRTLPGIECTGPAPILNSGTGAGPARDRAESTRLACRYRGLFFVLLDLHGPASAPDDPAPGDMAALDFLERQLASDDSSWQLCSWHIADPAMSLSDNEPAISLRPYTLCKDSGAIIATAHSHNYSRTTGLTRFAPTPVVDERARANELEVRPGATFAFVSGLGGNGIDPVRCRTESGEDCGIWARSYDGDYGALFIDFTCRGKARGYFKTIAGEIIDDFTVTSTRGSSR